LICPEKEREPPAAGECLRDSDCAAGMTCRAEDRQCIDPGQLAEPRALQRKKGIK
jgi:Cys-rich repeat protein